MMYKQCEMKKDTSIQTAWIPEHLAHVGQHVWIKDNQGSREYGWRVFAVGSRLAEDVVLSHEQEYKKHQTKTDYVRDEDGRWVPVR